MAGGGAVGAALACALADSGASVLLADPWLDAAGTSPAFAPRPIALSLATQRVLASLGVWADLAPAATAIESIHVSEAGRFGAARLEAPECGVGRFGSVVAAGALGTALRRAVARRGAIARGGGRIVDADVSGGQVASRMVDTVRGASSSFHASLLVVADGGRSELREALGIDASTRDYRQCAIASVVTARAPRARTAFERFTPGGPVALLPMGDARYGLVWSCDEERARDLAALPGRELAGALAAVFAGRLGGFDPIDERAVFPLRLVRAGTIVGERTVLIGNAANHLHPVAGQGFNLGMRDVACLAEVVAQARRDGREPGDAAVLERYRRWRVPDHAAVARFTDGLVDLFGHRCSPLAPLRAPALVALDLAPALKRALARRAMGLSDGCRGSPWESRREVRRHRRGGGLVGATLALALGRMGLRVAVVERSGVPAADPGPAFGARVSAFTVASERILRALGAWSVLPAERIGPMRGMHVWERTGEVHFDSAAIGEPCLGHIIENAVVQRALEQRIETLPNVEWHRERRCAGLPATAARRRPCSVACACAHRSSSARTAPAPGCARSRAST